MKKTLLFSAVLASAVALTSCGETASTETESTTTENTTDTAPEEAITYNVETASSNIRWEGGTAGIQVYSHFGSLDIKEGSLTMEGSTITAGEFVVDMTTINPQDSGYSEEHPPSDLVGHLSTGDFFLVDSFPTASFVVKSHNGNQLVGDLTVRGNTNEETIEIESLEVTDAGVSAKGRLVFNRQDYDVAWEHYMKDVTLSNDIELDITLQATK